VSNGLETEVQKHDQLTKPISREVIMDVSKNLTYETFVRASHAANQEMNRLTFLNHPFNSTVDSSSETLLYHYMKKLYSANYTPGVSIGRNTPRIGSDLTDFSYNAKLKQSCSQTNSYLRIADSTIPDSGLGVFSIKPIPPGQCVAAYHGEWKTKKRVDLEYGASDQDLARYCIQLSDSDWCIDAIDADFSSIGRYFNEPDETKQPNVYFKESTNPCKTVWITTLRDIAAHEELLVNYNYSDAKKRPDIETVQTSPLDPMQHEEGVSLPKSDLSRAIPDMFGPCQRFQTKNMILRVMQTDPLRWWSIQEVVKTAGDQNWPTLKGFNVRKRVDGLRGTFDRMSRGRNCALRRKRDLAVRHPQFTISPFMKNRIRDRLGVTPILSMQGYGASPVRKRRKKKNKDNL
jgi:hypothetical protein